MVLAIVFMYIFAFLLIPLLMFTLYVAFDGDRWRAEREAAAEADVEAPAPTAAETPAAGSNVNTAADAASPLATAS